MGMINAVGSLRYDMHGRKRKTNSLSTKKRGCSSAGRYTPTAEEIQEQMRFEKEKQEISKGYTIAPAYNKGAYQVVPNSEIKCIGKK